MLISNSILYNVFKNIIYNRKIKGLVSIYICHSIKYQMIAEMSSFSIKDNDTSVEVNLWYFDWNTLNNKMDKRTHTHMQNKQLAPNRLMNMILLPFNGVYHISTLTFYMILQN